jgi:hypothetical protein
LKKRVDAVETPEQDLVDLALNVLTYDEVCLLEEAKTLDDAGFPKRQMPTMMAEKWEPYKEAVQKLNQ